MKDNLKDLVVAAQSGDKSALTQVVRAVQDRVHHLAMRMLANPEDARDATQEILILVVTKLSTFRGESAFGTWVYRVAANYLTSARKVVERDPGLSFEAFRADLEDGLLAAPPPEAEDRVLLNELRISCTMALLLCLDLKHRIAYVLGDILELDHGEAAEVLGISKDSFRQRLSRARREVVDFTLRHCGLAAADATCSCPRRLPAALALGRVRPGERVFAPPGASDYAAVVAQVEKLEGELKVLQIQNATPSFKSPADLGARIARIVSGSA